MLLNTQRLLNNGIDRCLYQSAKAGHLDLVQFTINKGASLWEAGLSGAAKANHRQLFTFFADKVQEHDWETAIHYAVMGGHLSMIEFVMEKTKNWQQITDLVARSCHLDVIKWFVSKGLSKKQLNKALMAAVSRDQLEHARVLIDGGADSLVDAMNVATWQTNQEMIALLKVALAKVKN